MREISRSGLRYLMKNMPVIPNELKWPNHAEPNITISSGAPASFDWRDHPGAVTGVYNQGQCGSCVCILLNRSSLSLTFFLNQWAFSATENHESRFALQHGRSATSMSVQQILDCDAPERYGCNGGWPYQAWDYIYV